jgi:2-dehydro-3-deoxyphosphogluconate aldolase/(4S)-4-hydroxy-2-oxoglutarate aldolase
MVTGMDPTLPAGSVALKETPIIVVLRATDTTQLPRVIEALIDTGIKSIELTLTTPGVLDHLESIRDRVGSAAEIGVGTVVNGTAARAAIDAGAAYLVTPAVNLDVVAEGVRAGVRVIGGGLTPTELLTTWQAGATAVKVFPACVVGPQYLGQLRGPFPSLPVVPSGGVDEVSGPEWIRSGAAAISVGGPLLRDVFSGGDLQALQRRAKDLVDRVRAAKLERGKA